MISILSKHWRPNLERKKNFEGPIDQKIMNMLAWENREMMWGEKITTRG